MSDFDDPEDNKFNVRSAIDALGESMKKPGKRGRPRKYPASKSRQDSVSTSRRKSHSRVLSESEHDSAGEEEEEEEEVVKTKRKKAGSDDEEWDEEQEELTVAQRRERRTRKKPTLYSEESVAREQRVKSQATGSRRSNSGTGKRKSVAQNNVQYERSQENMAVIQNSFSKEEKDQLDKMRQQWRDIENPVQAKHRILPLLRRGHFEKCLELITPVPDKTIEMGVGDGIMTIFNQITCSAGFLQFVKNIPLESCLAIYDICDKLFALSNVADNVKIAQALRFWWNSLSFKTRRRWERHARKLVYLPIDKNVEYTTEEIFSREAAQGSEVPLKLSAKRRAEEAKWADLHSRGLAFLDEVDTAVICPLCEKDEKEETVRMGSIREIQEHFFRHHWQVHGYACPFCGVMYPTEEDLVSDHSTSDCQGWIAWNASRILAGTAGEGKLKMVCARMMLCCAECGWHMSLTGADRGRNEQGPMDHLRAFFAHHDNDGLLTMMVYFPATPTPDVTSLRFPVTSMTGGDPLSPCAHCGPSVTFGSPSEANVHYMKEHRDKPLVCEECQAQTTTEYLFNQHKMSHVHDNSFFAEYLLKTARIFPPPTNLSHAPRCGWKNRAKTDEFAFGGPEGGVRGAGFKLVDLQEDVREAKARIIKQRRKEGKVVQAGGYTNAVVPDESAHARKVREKLRKKYPDDFEAVLDDPTWFTDDQADAWKELMAYWETPEGRKHAGLHRDLRVDPLTEVSIPTVEVELHFKDMDVMSGFLLNDQLYYCLKCDSLLKGDQAAQHLKLNIGEVDEETCCAFDQEGFQENPFDNQNMYPIFNPQINPSSHSLPCPQCPKRACSITGLRVHMMSAHGVYVKCKPVPNERMPCDVVLKFDIRSKLAKQIDASLRMPPSGMLPVRQPLVTDPRALEESTWQQILITRENTNPKDLEALRQLIEEDRVYASLPQGTTRPVPSFLASRRRAMPPPKVARFAAPALVNHAPQQRVVHSPAYDVQLAALRNGLQPMQQQPGRGMNNIISPLARLPPVRAGGHYARTIATSTVRVNKLVSAPSYTGDGKAYYKCNVCTGSTDYEPELLIAHLIRCHVYPCGHCTAVFVFVEEAKKHAKKCRAEKNQQLYHPDPRLPHIKARCPYHPVCADRLPMVEMPMHLMDKHLTQLEFELPNGRLRTHILMVEDRPPVIGKEPEVERLRYKYYSPPLDLAVQQGCHQCLVCGLVLPDHGKLLVHLKLHPEFSYFCWLCPRPQSASLGTIHAIIKHLKECHLPIKGEPRTLHMQQCPLCQKNIANRALQHLMYECEHNFMCTLCRDLPLFESVSELREHREKCHYNSIRRFECSHCEAFFSTTQDFMRHVCDPANMKTVCSCGMSCKTRKAFVQHFQQTHIRGQCCSICHVRIMDGGSSTVHIQSHGTTVKPKGFRHMLMCAYGTLNNEVKSLFTHISNSSMRIRSLQGLATTPSRLREGGSPESPLQLSDDDDVIALDSSAVQRERQQAAAAAAHVPMPQLKDAAAALQQPPPIRNGRVGAAERVVSDAAVCAEVLRTLVNTVVQDEERQSLERRAKESASRNLVMELPENVLAEVDDDCVMIDDDDVVAAPPPPTTAPRTQQQGQQQQPQDALTAHVRVEDTATSSVGGKNQPGYKDDDDEPACSSAQPVIRQFAPVDDDDLCVVTEIENPGSAAATATLSKQREKKFGCPKCSTRFITQRTLNDHLKSAHQFDAGETTITEELGLPTHTAVWICKSCCLAFQTLEQKRAHNTQHGGQRAFGCESCSCVAYNGEVMTQHQRKLQEHKITYVCGECKFEFEHETNLHEHSRDKHAATLLYFCKACEMGSTDGLYVYHHFMMGECNSEFQPRARTQEEASRRIGVCPANQMHFQPIDLAGYKEAFARVPNKFVPPSLCSHRSLIVAGDKQVSCRECRCLENMQRHVAMLSSDDDAYRKYEASVIRVRTAPPLSSIRMEFERKKNEEMGRNTMRQQQEMMIRQHMGPQMRYPGAGAPHGMQMLQPPRTGPQAAQYAAAQQQARYLQQMQQMQNPAHERAEATRRFNERVQAAQVARAGGGGRPPVLTPGTMNGGYAQNGGPAILRHGMGHQPHYPQHTPPVMTRAPLSTMGSLQSIAAMAQQGQAERGSSSSHSASPAAPPHQPSQCSHCNAPILTARDAFLHTLHTAERGSFVCSSCPIAIKDERSAIKHIVNHMDQRERQLDMDMECPFVECQVEMPTLIMLKSHLIAHNPPLRHRIRSCHLTFATAELAKTHEEIHQKSSRKSDCCVLCGTMDNWEMEMTDARGRGTTIRHVMKHAMEHKYYCKICDMRQFEKESQMVTHYIMHHTSAEGDERSCSQCNEKLVTDNDHKVHCLTKHTITELYRPPTMMIRVPQEFSDYLGIGL